MFPNVAGVAVQECWNALPEHYTILLLDAFVVMPNHIHGILMLEVGAGFKQFQTRPPRSTRNRPRLQNLLRAPH
jgi:REP element-mobilizing transposase RayT